METLESREAGLEHASTRWGRTLAVGSAAWAALVLCRTAARLIAVGSGQRTVLELLLLTASVNAYWLVAVPAMLWIRATARESTSRGRFIVATLVAAVAVILAEPLWYRMALGEFRGDPLPWAEAVLSRGDINTLIVILALVGAWVAESYATARLRQRQHDVLESTLVDAELRALTLQLQPHFLFNTLQLAAEAAYDDLAAARRIVADLQTLLRRSFAFEEQRLVTVADEVDFLESYVAIQQRRFGARLSVRIEVDDEARARAVPPLLLQPLVENSIQHGVGRLARNGEIVGEFVEGNAAIEGIRKLEPDVVLLDIHIPEKDGLEVARAIQGPRGPAVVFVTAFDQYALRAFEVHAVDYLVKPIDGERLHAALARAEAQRGIGAQSGVDLRSLTQLIEAMRRHQLAETDIKRRPRDRLLVAMEGRSIVVPVAELDWIEAAGNYVRLHRGNQRLMMREPLASIETSLDPQIFARVHRGAIVNISRIKEVQPWFSGAAILILTTGQRLTVSRSYRKEFEARFGIVEET